MYWNANAFWAWENRAWSQNRYVCHGACRSATIRSSTTRSAAFRSSSSGSASSWTGRRPQWPTAGRASENPRSAAEQKLGHLDVPIFRTDIQVMFLKWNAWVQPIVGIFLNNVFEIWYLSSILVEISELLQHAENCSWAFLKLCSICCTKLLSSVKFRIILLMFAKHEQKT